MSTETSERQKPVEKSDKELRIRTAYVVDSDGVAHPTYRSHALIGRQGLVDSTKTRPELEEDEEITFLAHSFQEAMDLEPGIPQDVIEKLYKKWDDARRVGQEDLLHLPSLVTLDETDTSITEEQEAVYEDFYKSLEYELGTHAGEFVYMGGFVQVSTRPAIERRALGNKLIATKRIYLNPRQVDRMDVFKTIVEKLSNNGVAAKMKVQPYITNDPRHITPDGIVVYVDDDEGDTALEQIQEVYKQMQQSFEGRTSVVSALEIAPGLALGGEPVGLSGQESLSSYLGGAIREVFQELDTQIKNQEKDASQVPAERQIAWLMKKIPIKLEQEHLNPKNWSFFNSTVS